MSAVFLLVCTSLEDRQEGYSNDTSATQQNWFAETRAMDRPVTPLGDATPSLPPQYSDLPDCEPSSVSQGEETATEGGRIASTARLLTLKDDVEQAPYVAGALLSCLLPEGPYLAVARRNATLTGLIVQSDITFSSLSAIHDFATSISAILYSKPAFPLIPSSRRNWTVL